MPVPKFPASVVALLGFIGVALAGAQPTLDSPWREIVTAVLAVGTFAGMWRAQASVTGAVARAHVASIGAGRAATSAFHALPALPPAVVGFLGFVATGLVAAQPTLSSPWYEIVSAALAVGTAVGAWGVHASVRGAVQRVGG